MATKGVDVDVDGETAVYVWGDACLGTHFCLTCGIVAYWRGLDVDAKGRRRTGFNLRLAEPEAVADIPSNTSMASTLGRPPTTVAT